MCGIILLIIVAGNAYAQLSPEDELKELQPAKGFDISLFASEPMITNPSAIDVDTHGRVWVAEIQWYRAAAKMPPADKIKVLEDTDGDGRADRVTVFAEGLTCPMSICVAGDKVFVATSPDLWVYEDKDGDLKADGPPQKVLTGFRGRNDDHGAHSLVLGPDHKWWMSHGDSGFKVAGTDGSKIEYRWGAVMRGELDGSHLELVAVNFRNPYEVCVSSFGESFLSDNDNDGNFSVRICWLLEGGNYGWYGRPPGKVARGTPFGEHWHFRGHIPGHVPATLVTGFGSPCGICFYEGNAFGPQYKNAPWHTDCGPREVRVYRHENAGAGMSAASEIVVSGGEDKYFRPDDICAAPDGSLFISDWYDGGVGGHAYNNPLQGRIFLLRPTGKKLERIGQPGPYSTVDSAIEGLKNPNLATQFLARERLLAAGSDSVAPLAALMAADNPNYGARALWVLDRIGGDARQKVFEQLKSPSGHMRALAVRILRRHGEETRDAVLSMANDPDSEVRREVLLALRTLRGEQADAALLKLASAYDGSDRYLLEAVNIAAADRGKQLAAALAAAGRVSFDNMDLIQALDADATARFAIQQYRAGTVDEENLSRLLIRLSTMRSLAAAEAVLQAACDQKATMASRKNALAVIARHLADEWKDLADKPALDSGIVELLAEPALRSAAIDLVVRHDLRRFAPALLSIAGRKDIPVGERGKALQGATRFGAAGATAACEAILGERQEALRIAALKALIDVQAWGPVKKVLQSPDASPKLKTVAAEHAVDSVAGAVMMLQLLDGGELSDDLRSAVLLRAAKHADTSVRALFERFVPAADRPQKLGAAVTADEILALTGDDNQGRKIFFRSSAARCNSCHRVHGFGKTIGPDLSQIGKKYELRTLLETILDPSKAIAPEYIVNLVETTGGEIHGGFIVEQDDKEVVLKTVEGKSIRLPRADVAAIYPQKQSMMPELVLQDITAQDAADLLAFLATLTDAPQPDAEE